MTKLSRHCIYCRIVPDAEPFEIADVLTEPFDDESPRGVVQVIGCRQPHCVKRPMVKVRDGNVAAADEAWHGQLYDYQLTSTST